MSLRTKLLLAQAPMALILVIISAFSVWMVSFLGSHSQTILKDNYRSVLAAQRMKEAIERMDSAALFLIAGRRDKGCRKLLSTDLCSNPSSRFRRTTSLNLGSARSLNGCANSGMTINKSLTVVKR